MRQFRDHNDALAAHTSWRRYIAQHHTTLRTGWLGDRLSRYGLDAASPSALAFHHMIDDTVNAETVWMSHEMMDLTQHAMEGFDATEPFLVEDAFIPHGFMVLPEPFYSLDVHGKKMAERAYLWRVDEWGCIVKTELGKPSEDGYEISYTFDLTQEGIRVEPVLRITVISHNGDEDDYTDEYAADYEEMLARGVEWGIVHTTAIPLLLVSSLRDVQGEGDHESGWLRFWRVAQRLMSERIITSERRKAARPLRREAARLDMLAAGEPRVIELRRPTERDSDPEGERLRNVEWTHRWLVRGHWRQQWYPSEGRHKQIRIQGFVKGPENLPLVIRERVWNWDR